MKQWRKNWRADQKNLDVSRLKFLDESSVKCGMTRLYGRALSNERVNDYVPDVRFERTSLVSVLGIEGVSAPMMFNRTLNGSLFSEYMKHFLAPNLQKGDILILDNCSAHKVQGALDPIYERGADVLFLPPYSPDLNLIEMMWSKVK